MNFIGKIEWLRIDGRPREVREFETVEQLNEKADEQLEMGAPISIVLYTVEGKFPDFVAQSVAQKCADAGCLPCSFRGEEYGERNTYLKYKLDNETSLQEFYNLLHKKNVGNWERVNDRETIKAQIKRAIDANYPVSNILKKLEENDVEFFDAPLDFSAIPVPIADKNALCVALGLGKEELDKIIL